MFRMNGTPRAQGCAGAVPFSFARCLTQGCAGAVPFSFARCLTQGCAGAACVSFALRFVICLGRQGGVVSYFKTCREPIHGGAFSTSCLARS